MSWIICKHRFSTFQSSFHLTFLKIIFSVETKAKILAERDRASAEAAFKALDTDGDGR